MSTLFSSSYPSPGQQSQPPRPMPFHMTDPFQDRGMGCFWLSADDHVLQFVSHLSCVLNMSYMSPFVRRPQGRALIAINPRYDVQEVWLWIYELLETETREIELDQTWENAITAACTEEPDDTDYFD
ncbi:MAG: hypothetical protein K8L97_03970 [Anaerolineae bacterium]|nr:hypothetical protein [Anaerolineae bacterium]